MEVTKGICRHESYLIPWEVLDGLSAVRLKEYQVFQISQEEYEKTREIRIRMLMENCNYTLEELERNIPKVHQPLSVNTWKYTILDLLKPLPDLEYQLLDMGLQAFGFSGNIEDKVFTPWQITDENRYVKRKV